MPQFAHAAPATPEEVVALPASRRLSELNLPPISFVGHDIGMHLHEDPYIGRTPEIGKTGDATLEAGVVIGVEPLRYQTG